MIPDLRFAVDKAKNKFPVILQRAGWLLLALVGIMYAALGLVGFLIFLAGILALAIVQVIIIVRYIVNENKRVKERQIEAELE